jgi:glycosyltransferase involved in cell wall biosynthesis
MHVGLFGKNLAPGGAERLIAEEASYLSEQGCETSVIVPAYDEEFVSEMFGPDSVSVIDYRELGSTTDNRGFLSRLNKTRLAVSRLDLDLAISHAYERELYLINRIWGGPPYACQVNGTPFWFENDANVQPHGRKDEFEELLGSVPGHSEFRKEDDIGLKRRFKGEIGEYLTRKALQHSKAVFVLSQQVAREVEALYDVDPVVARAGISKSWLNSEHEIPRQQLSEEKYTILSVSRLDPRKRIDLLIRSFGKLRNERSDVGLAIVGTGPEEEHLKRTLEKEDGLEANVTFHGYVPDEDLPSYYKSADVFACPGWMSYGLTPLEAYGVGTKVAISSDAFAKEILRGEPGVITSEPNVNEWANKLSNLIDRTNVDINKSVIPTWEDFYDHRYEVLSGRGIVNI